MGEGVERLMVFDSSVGRYRNARGHFLPLGATKLVCGICGKAWRGVGSPARCPDCGKTSYAISTLREKKEKHGTNKGKSNS